MKKDISQMINLYIEEITRRLIIMKQIIYHGTMVKELAYQFNSVKFNAYRNLTETCARLSYTE